MMFCVTAFVRRASGGLNARENGGRCIWITWHIGNWQSILVLVLISCLVLVLVVSLGIILFIELGGNMELIELGLECLLGFLLAIDLVLSYILFSRFRKGAD